MRLALLHPEVAARPCGDCVRWVYRDAPDAFGERVERGGKPVPRVGPPPCSWCRKQPDDVPEADRSPATAVELSDRNWLAWRHYRECRAVGAFPDDPVVRQNAAVVRQAEDHAAAVRQLLLAAAATRR